MWACALCGGPVAQDSRSVLCGACQDANRARIHYMGDVDQLGGSMVRAYDRIREFQEAHPEHAGLVERARLALAADIPAIAAMRVKLHAEDRKVDDLLDAAHKARRGVRG